MKARIDIIGDPLLDLWNDSYTESYEYGGALNVYNNLTILSKELDIDINPVFELPVYDIKQESRSNFFMNYPCKKYLLEDNKIVNQSNFLGHPLDSKYLQFNKQFLNVDDKVFLSALVVSDYNKGFVTKTLKQLFNHIVSYDFIIVDSRYANTDFSLLSEHTDVLIHRRTKGIDKVTDYPFNYVIETDGPGIITIKDCELDISTDYVGEVYSARSTCGAGDVFTSSLAVYLTNFYAQLDSNNTDFNELMEGSITDYALTKAVGFAFDMAQQAVSESTFTCKVPFDTELNFN